MYGSETGDWGKKFKMAWLSESLNCGLNKTVEFEKIILATRTKIATIFYSGNIIIDKGRDTRWIRVFITFEIQKLTSANR
jgi:hypothetical protein